MSQGKRLDRMFYVLDADIPLEAKVERAKQSMNSIKDRTVAIKGDTSKLEQAASRVAEVDRRITAEQLRAAEDRSRKKFNAERAAEQRELAAKRAFEQKMANRPEILAVDKNILNLEAGIGRAQALLKKLPTGSALSLKLDADISKYHAKLQSAIDQANKFEQKPITAKVGASLDKLNAELKLAEANITRSVERSAKALLPASTNNRQLKQFVADLGREFTTLGDTGTRAGRLLTTAMESPALAAGLLASALVSVAAVGTKMAADVDEKMRELRANTSGTADQFESVRLTISEISQLSIGRTQQELAGIASAISAIGEKDADAIERTLRNVVLVGDALNKQDVQRQVEQVSELRRQYDLTNEAANQAFLEIAGLAQGEVALDKVADASRRTAPTLHAVGVGAVDANASIIQLLKRGIDMEKLVDGMNTLLNRASDARERAQDATGSEKKALTVLADTLNSAKLQQDGYLVTLSNLFKALGGTQEGFKKAGLEINQFTLAATANAAVVEDTTSKTQTYEDRLRKLQDAAATNRDGANALARTLKQELNAELIDLGNVILPTVNSALKAMVDFLATGVPGAVRRTRDALKELKELQGVPTSGFGGTVAFKDGVRPVTAGERTQSLVNQIRKDLTTNPRTLANLDAADLKALIILLTERAKTSATDRKLLESALEAYNKAGYGQAKPFAITAQGPTAPSPEATARQIAAAQRAAEALAQLRSEAEGLLNSVSDAGPITRLTKQIQDFEQKAIKAKMPAQELEQIMTALNGAREIARQAASAATARDFETFMAGLTVSQVDDLTIALAAQEEQLKDWAKAARDAGDKDLAKSIENALPTIRDASAQLITVTKALEGVQAVKDRNDGTPDGFNGQLQQLDLLAEKKKLEAIRAQITEKKALKLLDDTIREINQSVYGAAKGTANETSNTLQNTIAIASAVEDGVRFALGLSQAFGDTNSQLTKTLSNVMQVASGIRSLSQKASDAGGYSSLFSSTKGLFSALPVVGGIIGGLFDLGKALLSDNPKEKRAAELAKANTDALKALTLRIGDLAGANISGNDYFGALKAITALLDAPSGRISLDRRQQNAPFRDVRGTQQVDGSSFYGAEGLSSDDIRRIASELGIAFDGTVASLRDLEAALKRVDFSVMTESVGGLQNIFALLRSLDRDTGPIRTLADTKEILARLASPQLREQLSQFDLSSESGRAGLRDFLNALVRNLIADGEDTFKLLGDLKIEDFLQLVASIVGGIDDFTQSLEGGSDSLGPALDRIRERTTLFALNAREVLGDVIRAYGTAFPTVGGLLKDFNLESKAGIEEAITGLQAYYAALTSDGIQDGEQAIIDAILAIVDALRNASSDILTAAEQLAQRGEEISNAFGTNSNRVSLTQRFNTPYGGRVSGLEKIGGILSAGLNAGANVPTSADGSGFVANTKEGLLGYREAITAAFNSIAADGVIDAAEQATVDILLQLLDAIDEAIAEFDSEAEATRGTRRESVLSAVSNQKTLDRVLGVGTADSLLHTAQLLGGPLASLIKDTSSFNAANIEGTRDALRGLLKAALDGTIPLEQLGDLTKEDFIAAVIELLTGVDTITQSFVDKAAELKASAFELQDLDIQIAAAKGQDVRLQAFDLETQQKLDQYKAAGKDDAFLNKYTELRGIQRGNLVNDMASELSPVIADSVANAVADSINDPRTEFIASAVTSITQQQALRLTDYAASQLVVLRDIYSVLRSGTSMLSIPAVSTSFGGLGTGTNTTTHNNAPIVININLSGPIVGQSPQGAAEQLARELLPVLNRELARSMNRDRQIRGGSA